VSYYNSVFKTYKTKHEAELDKPEFWGGYRLDADYYEFWQGRPNRLHDRLSYEKQNGLWIIQRLMP
jgi:pyridoxamine 5'-phosphate oxidase